MGRICHYFKREFTLDETTLDNRPIIWRMWRASSLYWCSKAVASDVLDRCGDHDDAALLQAQALALMGLQIAETEIDTDPALMPTLPAELWRLTMPGGLM